MVKRDARGGSNAATMNGYYTSPLSSNASQQRHAQRQQGNGPDRTMPMINTATTQAPGHGVPLSAMSDIPMDGNDALDNIVRQNADELHRRRSAPQSFPGQIAQDVPDNRLSLMDFGHTDGVFDDFQFGDIVGSTESMAGGFAGMGSEMGMPGHSGPFTQSNLMSMADQAEFGHLAPEMMGDGIGGMMQFSNLNVGSVTANPRALQVFNPPNIEGEYSPTALGPATGDFSMDMSLENDRQPDEDMMGGGTFHPSMPPPLAQDTGHFHSPIPVGPSQTLTRMGGAANNGPMTPASTAGSELPDKKSIYSKSGFDMLRALWYVASRKNQKLNIGAVDLSCAFVVCDVEINDCPIIYVSDNFQNLTGYNRHEIVGKNCRFLQSPTGEVEAGSKREFVENHAVKNLKDAIAAGEEIQQSLINYRKGGKPFLNLLTMIPIPWDTDEIRYFIGFQIDLVECPDAVMGHATNGAMDVNYVQSSVGRHVWEPPNPSQWEPESGQTLGIDDVSTLLQSFNPTGVASDWHKQSWDKMLLENMDDVVHVISLKGLFLYLSPSCKRILEYDANDLVGTYLSSICHPSDIVPVNRDLKESQHNTPVSVVFRIRRKDSGYTWFESHGTLFSEQGKGRKYIILVGRKRPVFTLYRRALEANGGIGDSEIWTKMSTSGMFLFVSASIRPLLDLMPADLEGTSMQDLMRKETRQEFGRTVEKARQGKIVSCKHEIQNKRGQVLQAYTTFYPGDVPEGQKPSFLLAQTKLLKASSRANVPAAVNAKSSGAAAGESPNLQLVPGTVSRSSSGLLAGQGASGLYGGQSPPSQTEETDNLFGELKTTRATSWQFELRQMERTNRSLAEELAQLLSSRKKRKRRKGSGVVKDCANCHTRSTPEWRRGPSGNRDLCNSCGLRWAKQVSLKQYADRSLDGPADQFDKTRLAGTLLATLHGAGMAIHRARRATLLFTPPHCIVRSLATYRRLSRRVRRHRLSRPQALQRPRTHMRRQPRPSPTRQL